MAPERVRPQRPRQGVAPVSSAAVHLTRWQKTGHQRQTHKVRDGTARRTEKASERD